MQMNEIRYDSAVPVDGYGPGFFRINGEILDGPVIATGERAISWSGLDDVAALEALASEVDVIFLGTGAEISYAPQGLRRRLEEAGLGVEVMSSPAACRTYNILLAEGRRVALAALPV